ncbi:leucine rich repeat (LRR) protein [Chitinophaga dinghuensis]|uniref:Leucine rich repeat (LRR) protein n=1 Tax=Chitinophaga dinghuensis TaxID=1539050 RepID=A0A327VW32_9BACT|nr:leucine-rich repeat domain-containing protein [Chitinophaga dinghuensis]RAJ80149.1 leucine rich repeat (LRR) protein [Chitinophaga dinghuensis]
MGRTIFFGDRNFDIFDTVVRVANVVPSDYSPLAEMKNLRELYIIQSDPHGSLYAGADTDLSPLATLQYLEVLVLQEQPVADISALQGIETLKRLDLRETRVRDTAALSDFTSLEELVLRNTAVTDIKPIAALSNLKKLDIAYTAVTDLSALSNLTRLQSLLAEGSQISDVTPLLTLPRLTHFTFHETRLSSLCVISQLKCFQTAEILDLSGTEVDLLYGISEAEAVKEVRLYNMKVLSFLPLLSLSKLGVLRINTHQIPVWQVNILMQHFPDLRIFEY